MEETCELERFTCASLARLETCEFMNRARTEQGACHYYIYKVEGGGEEVKACLLSVAFLSHIIIKALRWRL